MEPQEGKTMELREQKYVLTIAACRNVSQAAEKLHITQPALSAFLLKLEHNLGGQLFVRHNRELTPTQIGALYIEKAAEIMEINREFELALAQILQDRKIPLKIGVQMLRAPRIIPRLLLALKKKLPQIHADFVEAKGQALYGMLRKKELDMIICSELSPNHLKSGIESVPVREDHLILVSPRDNAALRNKAQCREGVNVIDLRDIAGAQFILLPKEHSMRQLVDALQLRLGVDLASFREVNRQEAALHLAAFGEGLAFTLDSYLPYFKLPRPVDYYCIQDAPSVNYSLIYLQDHFQEGLAKSLCAVLAKALKALV